MYMVLFRKCWRVIEREEKNPPERGDDQLSVDSSEQFQEVDQIFGRKRLALS